jgi:hypothetical protein
MYMIRGHPALELCCLPPWHAPQFSPVNPLERLLYPGTYVQWLSRRVEAEDIGDEVDDPGHEHNDDRHRRHGGEIREEMPADLAQRRTR